MDIEREEETKEGKEVINTSNLNDTPTNWSL